MTMNLYVFLYVFVLVIHTNITFHWVYQFGLLTHRQSDKVVSQNDETQSCVCCSFHSIISFLNEFNSFLHMNECPDGFVLFCTVPLQLFITLFVRFTFFRLIRFVLVHFVCSLHFRFQFHFVPFHE